MSGNAQGQPNAALDLTFATRQAAATLCEAQPLASSAFPLSFPCLTQCCKPATRQAAATLCEAQTLALDRLGGQAPKLPDQVRVIIVLC